VPAENLVGEENKGWDYAKFLLGLERVGIARIGISMARIRRIKAIAALEQAGGRPLIEDPRFLEKLASVEIELKALEITMLRVVSEERNRGSGKPNPASSILKLKGSELYQATTELLLEAVGPLAMAYQPEQDDAGSNQPTIGPDYAAEAAPSFFNNRKVSIYGGSNEIQRNIIAKAILGF
jgi:alkylation response protein AidB-like acyl-CoA dehydrogenase